MNTAYLYIARRLSLASEGNRISPAVGVGIAAVALAVVVMAAAIAIVVGFKREITSKVAGFNSHIVVMPTPDAPSQSGAVGTLTLTPSLKSVLDSQPYIREYSLQAAIPAILKTPTDFKGVYLKSLSNAETREFIASAVTSGSLPDFEADSARNLVAISRLAASRLGLKAGDRIDTYFIADRIIVRPLKVAAVFNSHFDSYDDAFIFGSLDLIRDVAGLSPNEATSIAISVDDFADVEYNSAELRAALLDAYTQGLTYRMYDVVDARQSGAGYFHWLSMLDTNVIVVLTLMTIVAVITLISGMLILMVDKVRVIALLSALGASRKMIGRIFMLLAARIALIGLLIGDAASLLLLYTQKATHFIPLDPDSYYIDFVPVEISIPAMLLLNAGVLAIIWISLILPSRFAGKAAPARTLARE